jgi:hypothetical protein
MSRPTGRELVKMVTISESVPVVASPQFEPANLSRTESGVERLALHRNHEGRAQAVRIVSGYGMTTSGAEPT